MGRVIIDYRDKNKKDNVIDYAENRRRIEGQKGGKQNVKADRRKSYRFFKKQRFMGIALLVFTMLTVKALEGDATIALITVPLGLYLILTRKGIW